MGAGELEVHHAGGARHACPDCFPCDSCAHSDSGVDYLCVDDSGSDVVDLCARSDSGVDDSDSGVDDFCAHVDDSDSDLDDFRARAGPDSGSDDFCDRNSFADDFHVRTTSDVHGYRPLRSGAVVLRHPRAELLRERHRQRRLGTGRQRHQRGRYHLPGGEYRLLVGT